jgi:hypothetical protein
MESRNPESPQPTEPICGYINELTQQHYIDICDSVDRGIENGSMFTVRNNVADGQAILGLTQGYLESRKMISSQPVTFSCIYEAFCFDRNFLKIILSFADTPYDIANTPRLQDIPNYADVADIEAVRRFSGESKHLWSLLGSAAHNISIRYRRESVSDMTYEAMGYMLIQFDRQLTAAEK